jgi:Cu+-exporting ATPase
MTKDPVCGMQIDKKTAKEKSHYKGKIYSFCSSQCKASFEKNPVKYAKDDASLGNHHHN